ncbi:adaptor-related protein complex 3, delta 1 subunit-like garnet isoform X2 [Dermatophagoides pteronyssinus]|uniref:adaptor-related protein complex 3, delta 1 subunit-like garnet isoform X2 n=1 Tax=Dermatophagoides pteronyssinus TaxID=6956 RepID=UPI003F6722BB
MNIRKVKGNFDRIFDKTLTDLVRGIRNNKENETKYIQQCIEEIKEELRNDSLFVKANAISKLTYLQMLGYDISWSAFNIIEVMSSTKFSHKRIGYLAASQSFHENTEVMMLTTNMIRKDLNSQNMYDAGCAMSGLACFVTADISRDLANDVMTLLSSTKPYLRKKAILLMYKIFLKFPEALKPAFPRLKEKLEDPDPGVQSAAVNVICELARKNPKNYLSLAPVFFKLMTNSTNNWMLIKIIKLFGVMTKYEPLLGIKLSNPLISLIRSTSAMSLLYECINTVIAVLISISSGLPNHNASIQLCVQKLRILIEDSDQNLKYLGLLAMNKILKTHPKSVQSHKDLVLACLDDKDESIRLRALDLLYGMVTKKNLMEIVQKLVKNVTEGQIGNKFRDELILKLIEICSQNDYQFIVNFEWYLSVLIDLARVDGGTIHGVLIAQQILDVSIRVDAIRSFATEKMYILLENSALFMNNSSVCEVLYAAAWICGEFADHLPDKEKTILNLLSIDNFQPHIIAVFIQNASKIFAKLAADPDYNNSSNKIYNLCSQIEEKIKPYLKNQNLEIQERATTLSEIIAIVKSMKNENISKQQVDKTNLLMNDSNEHSDAMTNGDDETNDGSNVSNVMINLQSFYYAYPLNPVAAKAQRKVPIPIGLDLDTPFDLPESEDESDDYGDDYEKVIHLVDDEQQNDIGESSDELNKRQEKNNNENELLRRFEQENNPNYLKTTKSSKPMAKKSKRKTKRQNENFDENNENEDSDKNEIFSQELSSTKQNASIPGLISSEKYLLQMKKTDNVKKDDGKYKKKTTKKKNTKVNTNNEDNEDEEENDNKISIRALEMPEGVDLNDNDEDDDDSFKQASDPHKALAKVNLDDVINDLNKMRQKTAIDSKIPETKEKTGKKKKSGKKVVVNDLITGKKVVKVAKSEKAGKKNDDPIIKLKDNSPVKMKPKKSNKVKKIADSKNRDEYEETLDKI